MESNVHFPTDLNLLWDACRKCIELIVKLCKNYNVLGWRKAKDWKKELKGLMRTCTQINKTTVADKKERLKKASKEYVKKTYELEGKIYKSIKELKEKSLSILEKIKIERLEYFQNMLIKHIDLIERRLLKGERIAHDEKIFSLFEPHTEWINKGKDYKKIELGHKLLITTCQYGLVLDYKVMEQSVDSKETLELADRLLNIYGDNAINSLSFDKGFSNKNDRELLELYIENLVMPKKGKLNKADKERESHNKFKKLRNYHSAIEANINWLEHHGLNRCLDKGLDGFKRYAGFGILAYNLHKIGNNLLEKQRQLKKAA